eukprot:1167546-Rhodomonas_salina.2
MLSPLQDQARETETPSHRFVGVRVSSSHNTRVASYYPWRAGGPAQALLSAPDKYVVSKSSLKCLAQNLHPASEYQ